MERKGSGLGAVVGGELQFSVFSNAFWKFFLRHLIQGIEPIDRLALQRGRMLHNLLAVPVERDDQIRLLHFRSNQLMESCVGGR